MVTRKGMITFSCIFLCCTVEYCVNNTDVGSAIEMGKLDPIFMHWAVLSFNSLQTTNQRIAMPYICKGIKLDPGKIDFK